MQHEPCLQVQVASVHMYTYNSKTTRAFLLFCVFSISRGSPVSLSSLCLSLIHTNTCTRTRSNRSSPHSQLHTLSCSPAHFFLSLSLCPPLTHTAGAPTMLNSENVFGMCSQKLWQQLCLKYVKLPSPALGARLELKIKSKKEWRGGEVVQEEKRTRSEGEFLHGS